MNLVIDQGNTKVKVAVFDHQQQIIFEETEHFTESEVLVLKQRYGITRCILSTVKVLPERFLLFLDQTFDKFVRLDPQTSLPFQVGYKTPHTLGMDRIAAIAGAWDQANGKPVVVIDAGTAITYDYMNARGIFEGGNIAPGIHLRFRALHEFTGKLPRVNPEGDLPFVGYSTETAIRSGVINGICMEIEGFIAKIKSEEPDVLVFLTGGDANFLAEKLKCTIFVDKKLVVKGLNRILNYNVEE
ncbi:MAG: type III pantothenate kinase [Bacteroidales bacterium]